MTQPSRFCSLAVCFASAIASAQEQDPTSTTPPTAEQQSAFDRTSFSLRFSGEWDTDADLDTSPGEVSVARLSAAFGASHTLENKQLTLRFGASVEQSDYDFSNATGLVVGTSDPFSDATIATVSLGTEIRTTDRNAWLLTAFVRSAGESGADFGDTISGGGVLGFRHTFSDTFTLGGGVIVASELEDDLYIIPFPIIRWNINDRWTLSSDDRAGAALSYKASDAWTLGVEGSYQRRQFRLDEDGPVPSGVVDDRRIPLALFATYAPSPRVTFTGRVGTNLWSEFEFNNSAGNKITDEEVSASIALGFDVALRF